jgi:hypothetical protein
LLERIAPTRLRDEKGLLPESYLDYCRTHKCTKATNQLTSRGMTYRCADCVKANQGNPRGGRSTTTGDGFAEARKAALANKLKDNPKCVTCREPLRKGKPRKRDGDGTPIGYYWKKCVNGCARTGQESEQKRNQLPDSFEALLPIIEEKVARRNGHHPQNRKDIVQDIALLVWRGAWTLDDLNDKKRLRSIIKATQSQYQDEYAPKGGASESLDEPVRGNDGEDSKKTYADRLESPAPSPEEELMAKEAGGGED